MTSTAQAGLSTLAKANATKVRQPTLYGGFIFPGSTFDHFHIAVSNLNPGAGYSGQGTYSNDVVSQWQAQPNLHP